MNKYYRYPFVMKKVFKWSEVHLAEVTSYKIHTLGCQVPTKLKQTKSSPYLNDVFGYLYNF